MANSNAAPVTRSCTCASGALANSEASSRLWLARYRPTAIASRVHRAVIDL
jgi:hypothetical protein